MNSPAPLRILVVDDDQALRELLTDYLTASGLAVDAASDGVQMRERLDHALPDAIVLDRGPAIPQDQLAAVFRPFHRIEGAATPVPSGFGLGLAIVQQLARANGWTVELERREGGGLAAWVELPVPA